MTKNPRPALDSGPGNLNFDLPGDKIPAGILFPGLPALDSVPGILFSGLPAEEILPGILFPGLPALDSGLGILSAARPALDAPGLLTPPMHAALALGLSRLAGLSVGDTVLLMVLGGSASYIAVPAAMRLVIPKANPGLYIPLPLAVTFPFNVALGIPLYIWAATHVHF